MSSERHKQPTNKGQREQNRGYLAEINILISQFGPKQKQGRLRVVLLQAKEIILFQKIYFRNVRRAGACRSMCQYCTYEGFFEKEKSGDSQISKQNHGKTGANTKE